MAIGIALAEAIGNAAGRQGVDGGLEASAHLTLAGQRHRLHQPGQRPGLRSRHGDQLAAARAASGAAGDRSSLRLRRRGRPLCEQVAEAVEDRQQLLHRHRPVRRGQLKIDGIAADHQHGLAADQRVFEPPGR